MTSSPGSVAEESFSGTRVGPVRGAAGDHQQGKGVG